MLKYSRISILIILNLFTQSITCGSYTSINVIYKNGVDAFTNNRWAECVEHFEEVLHLYKQYKSIWVNCRLKCRSQPIMTDSKEQVEDLNVFEIFIERKKCLMDCVDKGFHDVKLNKEINYKILAVLKDRQIYKYMQMCYYKIDDLPKAASTAYTYLVNNPYDTDMVNKLQFYVVQPEVNIKDIIDIESDYFLDLYKIGKIAYDNGNWGEVIAAMEECISDYLLVENSCRAECEDFEDQERSSEFIVRITENIKKLLHCKQKCQNKVKILKFDTGAKFIADVLNYLQISYYHSDRVNDAATAVSSYLLMFPDDEDMIENKQIYSTLVNKESFIHRPDIFFFYKRDIYEKHLLNRLHIIEDENVM